MFSTFLRQTIKERGDIFPAYLIIGELKTSSAEVFSALKNIFPEVFSVGTDIKVVNSDVFGVGESRQIRQMAENKPFSDRAIFILSAPVFTLEAQNALLKTMEEPQQGNYFFILTESAESLLATLRSRLAVFSFKTAYSRKTEIEKADEFLNQSPKDRLLFVSNLCDQEEKAPIFDFVSCLEEVVRKKVLKNKTDKAALQYLKFIAKSAGFLKRSGVSPKLILETLAAALPVSLRKNKEENL